MKEYYTVNIDINKAIVKETLLESFGGAENAVIVQNADGTLRIKEVMLEKSDVDASDAETVAQAVLDAHDVADIYDRRRKDREIKALYDTMNTEVYAQMATVFNTTNADSATANRETWALMLETPADWSGAGLNAEFDRGGLSIGDALDTDQKVTDYSQACLDAVKTYGIWRMQRVQQFRTDKAAVEAS